MSNGEVKKVSPQDLQLVQNLIERCLQLYMSQKEVVSTLLHQAKIEPSFTELVWQKLEEENQDFFKAYHLRLILKDQILKFNKLLETQAELMSQISPATSAASVTIPNGSHVPLMHQNSTCYTPGSTQAMKLENNHQSTAAKLPGGLTNGGSSLHPCMQSGGSMPPNLLMNQNSNMGIMHGMNGEGIIKSESGYAEEPSFMFNPANNVLERHPVMPEVPISSFIGEESNPKPVNEPIVEPGAPSFGFLGQIPRNFSLSDLTADFSISSGSLSVDTLNKTLPFVTRGGKLGESGKGQFHISPSKLAKLHIFPNHAIENLCFEKVCNFANLEGDICHFSHLVMGQNGLVLVCIKCV